MKPVSRILFQMFISELMFMNLSYVASDHTLKLIFGIAAGICAILFFIQKVVEVFEKE